MKAIQKALVLAVFALSVVSWALAQDRGLEVAARAVGGADVKIGKQYAVLIGIDRYAEWPSLRNPVKDAKAIKAVLDRRYFIDEFVELYDGAATATGIRTLFDDLINRVGPTDSVLIYFAGHGFTDKYATGFWIPSDGGKDLMSQDRWIGNTQIRNFMTLIKARSLALVSDSCFSGDLLNVQRGFLPTVDSGYYRNALRYTAKQVLTSGASETVPDESEFARQFKALLENNTDTYLDPVAMYDRIRRGVTKTLPLLGTLPGHETGGSFLLFLREVSFVNSSPSDSSAANINIGTYVGGAKLGELENGLFPDLMAGERKLELKEENVSPATTGSPSLSKAASKTSVPSPLAPGSGNLSGDFDFGGANARQFLGSRKLTIPLKDLRDQPDQLSTMVSFVIEPGGTVLSSTIRFEPPLSPAIEAILRMAFSNWQFSQAVSDGRVEFRYSIKVR